ncbi:hypothetical protein [Kitasatospora sp. NPDC004531]
MRIRHALAATAVGAALALGTAAAPALAAAPAPAPAPASSGATVQAVYTWQPTGELFRVYSTCKARASYYLAASNVKAYECRPENGYWAGWVYAS